MLQGLLYQYCSSDRPPCPPQKDILATDTADEKIITIYVQDDINRGENHFSCPRSALLTLHTIRLHSISELATGLIQRYGFIANGMSNNWPIRGLAAWHIAAYRQGPKQYSMLAASTVSRREGAATVFPCFKDHYFECELELIIQ